MSLIQTGIRIDLKSPIRQSPEKTGGIFTTFFEVEMEENLRKNEYETEKEIRWIRAEKEY